ncbi:MAG: type IX secretion system protein PorQ [Bacteroidaceae bacterium]|nr:type IX secretion system protein PorQ [Bacteroidaceae bacterium]
MRKIIVISLLSLMVTANMNAQEGAEGYEFLKVPTSAHSAALGGNNVSIIEDDASLLFTNPALIANVSDKTLDFNFTSYISSTFKLSASFIKQVGSRGTIGVGGMVLNYGEMTETTSDFAQLGTFSASDVGLQAGYTYLLSDRWSGGVQGKVILSNYGEFKSTALGVDLGLNYYDPMRGWSFSIVGQNLGGQVDPLYEESQSLPFNLLVGVSKEFANAPIRVSLTFDELTDWDEKKPINHLAFGADVFPTSTTWIALGYNPRRHNEMKVNDSSHWAGISIGGGINIKKFKLGVAYGKYHVAASSVLVNASYSF